MFEFKINIAKTSFKQLICYTILFIFIYLVVYLSIVALVVGFCDVSDPSESSYRVSKSKHHKKLRKISSPLPLQLAEIYNKRNYSDLNFDFEGKCFLESHLCFAFSRCYDIGEQTRLLQHSQWPQISRPPRIKVHVYPATVATHLNQNYQFSNEFVDYIQTVVKSKYFESDPRKACIFIPLIDFMNGDTLHDKSVIQSNNLKYWSNGKNHLLLNLVNIGSIKRNNSLKGAILATTSLESSTYRNGFDISVPLYNPLTAKLTHRALEWSRRKKWIIFTQMNLDRQVTDKLVEFEISNKDRVQLFRACQGQSYFSRCKIKDNSIHSYLNLVQSSQFCLIYKNRELKDQSAEAALFDAMRFNCIPVLIANEWILPFSEIIDWNLISIQIDVHNLKILPQMLDSLSQEKLKFMFNQLELVYSTYFSSIRAITLTILDIISFRVYPAFKLPYEFYNFRVKSYNKSPFILPYKPNSKLGFTLIVVSYDPQFYRDTMSLVRSSSLLEASQASKIIVLWYENVLKLSDLSDEKPSQSQKRVVFKTMNMHGSMQSRFFPLKEIETEAVMIVDEFALSKMDPNDFDTMFNAWLRIPKALVVLKLFENLNDDMSPFIYNSYLNRYFHGGSQKLNEVNFNCENKQFMRMFVNLTNNVVRVTPKNVKARDLSGKIESFSRINCDDYLL